MSTSGVTARDERFEKVVCVGLGYVGLPTAVMFASSGVHVLGVDVNEKLVQQVNRGEIQIVEAGLKARLANVVRHGMLRASARPEIGDAFILAVPTPFHPDRTPDLDAVEAATRLIAPVLAKGNLVILESTSPVGTTLRVSRWLGDLRPDLRFPHQAGESADVQVAHCPERVLPGQTLRELVHNDRVIGGMTARCARRAKHLYEAFVAGECLLTDAATAELAKLAENAFRDVNIAFANELSFICDRLGLDVWDLIRLANRHPRVNILQPGPGVGGHCVAVDPWFIVHCAPEDAKLIRMAREINDSKPLWVVGKIEEAVKGRAKPVIACLGLAYKPNIEDLRESPAVEVVREIGRRKVGEILVVEPHVRKLPPELAGLSVALCSLEEALARADVVVLLVSHEVFGEIEPARLRRKQVIDTRGIWKRTGSTSPRAKRAA